MSLSSHHHPSRSKENLIDGITAFDEGAIDWLTAQNQQFGAWVTFQFAEPRLIRKIVMWNQNEYDDAHRDVAQFTIQGSNDGSSYKDLYTSHMQPTRRLV